VLAQWAAGKPGEQAARAATGPAEPAAGSGGPGPLESGARGRPQGLQLKEPLLGRLTPFKAGVEYAQALPPTRPRRSERLGVPATLAWSWSRVP